MARNNRRLLWHPLSLIAWRDPTQLARLCLVVLAVAVPRFMGQSFDMIPHHLPFNPGVILLALAAMYWGPAAVWGGMIGVILGDFLAGDLGSLTVFRAAGVLVAMACIVRFVQPRILWCFIAACIMAGTEALGCEALERYPFAYVFTVAMVHHLGFFVLVAWPLSWVRAVNLHQPDLEPLRICLTVIGAILLGFGGYFASTLDGTVSFPHLGTSGGPTVEVVAGLGFLLAAVAVLFPNVSAVVPATSKGRKSRPRYGDFFIQ